MKKTLTAISVALAMTAPAYAEDHTCVVFGDLAEAIMEVRQAGISLSDAMRIATEDETDKLFIKYISDKVISAYEYPRFSTEKHKAEIGADFRNSAEVECYRALQAEGNPA